MTDLALKIWDGQRPRLHRDVLKRRTARFDRLDVVWATENLTEPTDWAFEENHHTIVVHLGGRLDRMDCEFSVGPSGSAIPQRGDVWVIPAACRYAALAQGERAEFVELHVPTELLADVPLMARVQHRDDFLFGSASRLSELMDHQGDDLARMASFAIVDAVRVHLLQRYGRRDLARPDRDLSASDITRLADFIRSQLGAEHSLDRLAGFVGMGERRFTAAFRRAFGSSPWQFVLRARLDEAARRLRETTEPVTEIALATGFATPSHFAMAFSRRFGVTPTGFRAVR